MALAPKKIQHCYKADQISTNARKIFAPTTVELSQDVLTLASLLTVARTRCCASCPDVHYTKRPVQVE
jgi:hypothetical protein